MRKEILILLILTIILLIPKAYSVEMFGFLWVPNSGGGNSVSKVNVSDAHEIGRYYTSNVYGDPSRTAIDGKGNVWVGNRQLNTLVKIGLLENGQCVDRNGNGKIETSRDLNGNGVIDSDEILPYGQDECFLKEVRLEYPDVRDVGGGNGVRAVCVDKNNNVYAGMFGLQKIYYISEDGNVLKSWYLPDYVGNCHPYGCIVDKDGYVWISCISDYKLVRYDPSSGNWNYYYAGYYVYGIAPCYREDCIVFNSWESSKLTKVNSKTLQTIWALDKWELYQGRGVIVDEDENIYAVSSYYNQVYKYDKNGNFIVQDGSSVCQTPTGVGIDKFGRVWVTCMNGCVVAFDKDRLNVLMYNCFGTGHYTYSDFSGYILTQITKPISFGCRICEPSQIDNYAWRGLCLFGNYVMCNPFFLVIIIILGIIVTLVSKLIPS